MTSMDASINGDGCVHADAIGTRYCLTTPLLEGIRSNEEHSDIQYLLFDDHLLLRDLADSLPPCAAGRGRDP